MLGVSYASEICPVSLRAFMTGWVNVCWSMGGFIATGVTTGTNQVPGDYVSLFLRGFELELPDANLSLKIKSRSAYHT